MPTVLRYFNLKMLMEQKEKESKAAKGTGDYTPPSGAVTQKNNPKKTINKPF